MKVAAALNPKQPPCVLYAEQWGWGSLKKLPRNYCMVTPGQMQDNKDHHEEASPFSKASCIRKVSHKNPN
jgi:hypothetical protein